MGMDWPFDDPPNLAVITTEQVLSGQEPVRLVVHDADDGSWQILCGTTKDPADARVVGLGELVARDPSLGQLAQMPVGWQAWRESPSDPWELERVS